MPGLLGAVAIATNQVRVTLSEAPMESGPHSALLPNLWNVNSTPGGQVDVTAVEEGTSNVVWVLTVALPWLGGVTYEVSNDLGTQEVWTAAGGVPYTAPSRAEFIGVAAAPIRRSLRRASGLDLRLQTLGDTRTEAGAFAMTSGGEYALWSGPDARESDYLRRLQTPKGGFAHVPEYGVGLDVKALASTAALLRAKREIETQMLREPDVVGVAPRIARLSGQVIQVDLRVRLAGGGEIEAGQVLGG